MHYCELSLRGLWKPMQSCFYNSQSKRYVAINDLSFASRLSDNYQVVAVVSEKLEGRNLREQDQHYYSSVKTSNELREKRRHLAAAAGSQLCDILWSLHHEGYIHRDIKPENILLADEALMAIKLCDMGYSKRLEKNKTTRTFCGSQGYTAPEIAEGFVSFKSEEHSFEADLWSLGATLLELITGENPGYYPFDGSYNPGDMYHMMRMAVGFSYLSSSEKRHLLLERFPAEFKKDDPLLELIVSLTEHNPKKRIQLLQDAEIVLNQVLQSIPSSNGGSA